MDFFFENIISHIKSFYNSPKVPVDIISFFFFNFRFSIRKSQSQQKLAKKITHFTIQFCSKNLTHFTNLNSLDIENNMLPQRGQKIFWLYKFSANMFLFGVWKIFVQHHFLTPKNCILEANWKQMSVLFLYISLRKFLFQRRGKVLSGEGWDGGGWIISLRQLAVWTLQNILQFFVLIDIFDNSTIF